MKATTEAETERARQQREDEKGAAPAYWRAVQGCAREIVEASPDDDRDDGDRIHEAADGSQWVIYTWRAIKVLEHSRNHNAGFEELGRDFLAGADSLEDVWTAAAFWAMRTDIAEAVAALRKVNP